ncbi:MAG: OadG family protein [Clostridia bacterium]
MENIEPINVVLLGFGTVFVGLICLIFITKLMSVIVGMKRKKENLVQATAVPAVETIQNRGAFTAAVASCIATTIGTDVSGLKILSIKKVN